MQIMKGHSNSMRRNVLFQSTYKLKIFIRFKLTKILIPTHPPSKSQVKQVNIRGVMLMNTYPVFQDAGIQKWLPKSPWQTYD